MVQSLAQLASSLANELKTGTQLQSPIRSTETDLSDVADGVFRKVCLITVVSLPPSDA